MDNSHAPSGDNSMHMWHSLATAMRSRGLACVGDFHHPDFAGLANYCNPSHRIGSPNEVLTWLNLHGAAPNIILVFQSRPDEVNATQLLQWQQAAPLTEWWLVLGSWCEGETRTGFPAPGIRRVYWHRLSAELVYEFQAGADSRDRKRGACRTWSLVDETLERAADEAQRVVDNRVASTLTSTTAPPVIFIRALEREAYAATAEYCQWLGYATSWLPMQEELVPIQEQSWPQKLEQASGVIWLGDITRRLERVRLTRLHRTCSTVPIVCLMHFPRRLDVAHASQCGAQAVVSLPMMVEDLRAAIERCFVRREPSHLN